MRGWPLFQLDFRRGFPLNFSTLHNIGLPHDNEHGQLVAGTSSIVSYPYKGQSQRDIRNSQSRASAFRFPLAE
jgi:hypothetical protein